MKKLYANIGKLITSSLQLDAVIEGIMEEVRVFFDPQNWSLMRLDPTTNQLFFVVVEGIDVKNVENIRLKVGEGIAGKVAETGVSIFVPNARLDPRFSSKVDEESGFVTNSIIAVPLIFQNKVFGVIELVNRKDDGAFTENDHLVMQSIADFSAIAFANALLFQGTLALANTDPLTKVFNRTKLDEIAQLWENGDKNSRRLHDTKAIISVFMVDLNDFKMINDHYSHQEGDRVLKAVAEILRKIGRDQDMAFRTGGDEFVLVVVYPDESHQEMVEERISRQLEKLSEITYGEGQAINFSYGVASGAMENIRQLIHNADLKMYKEKARKNT